MKFLPLIFAIVIAQLAGAIGSIFTFSAIPTWYPTLIKPIFNPPNWIFGPVWTTLYTLMGISSYLIWKKGIKNQEVKTALIVYAIHLVLNALWSILFFGLKRLDFAFFEITILWSFIIFIFYLFKKINKTAGLLLIPYFIWVSFASILNYSLWILNK